MRKTLHLETGRQADVLLAADLLRDGGLVAFPTETVYGLGANALSPEAVAGIFRAKGRPAWDPLIVHLASLEQVPLVARLPGELGARVQALAEAFWPGPLTLLLPRTEAIPDGVTAGRALVGVRVPRHPGAQELLRAAALPLAAPSANRFGHISPTTAHHVLADLDGKIDAVLDGGPCAVGVESTVLDPATSPLTIFRAGAVTADQIAQCVGVAASFFEPHSGPAESTVALPSPGVGIRHYAPGVPLRLTAGTPAVLWAAVEVSRHSGRRVGVLLPTDWPNFAPDGVLVEGWGTWDKADSLATGLFAGLRRLESSGAEELFAPFPEPGGMRDALRDRLLKASMPV